MAGLGKEEKDDINERVYAPMFVKYIQSPILKSGVRKSPRLSGANDGPQKCAIEV